MTVKLDRFKELQALPVSTVILGSDGTIVGVNDAWKDFADRNGMCLPNFGVGANYLDYCGAGQTTSRGLAKELKELLSGRRDLVTSIYPCHSPTHQRWFFLIGLPLAIQRRSRRCDPACRSHEGTANSNPCPRGQVEERHYQRRLRHFRGDCRKRRAVDLAEPRLATQCDAGGHACASENGES